MYQLESPYCTRRALVLLLIFLTSITSALAAPKSHHISPSRRASGFTNTGDVQLDGYSLSIKGQRVFIHSGEFHPFRLPVPSLWLDVLQKIKAAGMNAVSVGLHMGAVNPSPGVVDFSGHRALKPLFDAAMATGLWVILKPGPYIDAEISAGGLPLWATSQVSAPLRTSAQEYQDAWTPYIKGIIDQVLPYSVDQGGPVIAIQIDNEYTQSNTARAGYFQQLEEVYRDAGIVVPLTYNDAGLDWNFINGTGAVDLYGTGSYPQKYTCSLQNIWNPVPTGYYSYHEAANPSQPFYISEYQAGGLDGWGPDSPGYDACRDLLNPDFLSVFSKNLWANNAKMINYYVMFGGTSWGSIPNPNVYTSYDRGAAIMESRQLTANYDEIKLQSNFLRSSSSISKTVWMGNSTNGAVTVNNPAAFVDWLQSPDSGSNFYVARHTDSTSSDYILFSMIVKTTLGGMMTIPQVVAGIALDGHESKTIVSDYKFGTNSTLIYSTAAVYFAGVIGNRDVVLLYGDPAHVQEWTITLAGSTTASLQAASTQAGVTTQAIIPGTRIFAIGQQVTGLLNLYDTDKMLLMYADQNNAARFFAPMVTSSTDNFGRFWQFGSNSSVLVGGPSLVRSASVSGNTLALTGDLDGQIQLSVIGPETITAVTWNGRAVTKDSTASSKLTTRGGFAGTLSPAQDLEASLPILSGWRYADSLPEIQAGFDDSQWMTANRTTTNLRAAATSYGDGRILYGCDYGFCENAVLWRGHFNASGQEKSVNLSIVGGNAFAGSVWLNDVFLGTSSGGSQVDKRFVFPASAVVAGKDNVVTVVQDNMGLEGGADNDSKSPRGISGFSLEGGKFTTWKVQGKVGGYTSFPDRVRGIVNEGGLYGERRGWHLPGFDTSLWTARDLASGLPNDTAGVGFFVTAFKLAIPTGLDVAISFDFESDIGQTYRASLFVNGWNMGKRIADIGPQWRFPVQQGILDYNGENTVAVALWSTDNKPVTPSLQLSMNGIVEGGVSNIAVNNPKWSSAGRA